MQIITCKFYNLISYIEDIHSLSLNNCHELSLLKGFRNIHELNINHCSSLNSVGELDNVYRGIVYVFAFIYIGFIVSCT